MLSYAKCLFEKIGANLAENLQNVKNVFLAKSSGSPWVKETETFKQTCVS